jgi:hypothetical protein
MVTPCLQAAPVTFAFDAEITNIYVSPSASFDLPFEVDVGDTIHGRFTFEPAPLGRMGRQDLGLQFEIGGVQLQSPTYDLSIALRQYPPLGFEPFEPFDLISVSCSILSNYAQCEPGTVPGASHINWRTLMTMAAAPPILSSHDLIGDVELWNSFQARSVDLNFTSSGLGGGLVSVSAEVGRMFIVPEPLGSNSLFCGMIALVTLYFTRSAICVHHHRFRGLN